MGYKYLNIMDVLYKIQKLWRITKRTAQQGKRRLLGFDFFKPALLVSPLITFSQFLEEYKIEHRRLQLLREKMSLRTGKYWLFSKRQKFLYSESQLWLS